MIIEAFYKILWYDKLSNANFRNSMGITTPWDTLNLLYNQHLYTPAKCMLDTTPCDNVSRCCETVSQIHLLQDGTLKYVDITDDDEEENDDIKLSNYQSQYIYCDSVNGCGPHCFAINNETYYCCDYLTITPNTASVNSSGGCCYTFNISTSNSNVCVPVSLSIKDIESNTTVTTTSVIGTHIPPDSICVARGSGVHHFLFTFLYSNGDTCQKRDTLICPSDSCCPQNKSEWLHTEVRRDTNCGNGIGCRVYMNLDIPSEYINCFSYYYIDYNGISSIWYNIRTHPVWKNSYCISNNSTGTIVIHLFNGDSTRECDITKYVSCDSTVLWEENTIFNCTPSCPDSVWTTRNKTIIISSECSIDVTYSYRISCDGTQELQINKMKINGNCGGYLDKEIFQMVIDGLVDKDPMGFNPLPKTTGCYYDWRIINGSCSKWDLECYVIHYPPPIGDLDIEKLVIIPCSDSCCAQGYVVCRYPDHITIDTLGPVSGLAPIYCPMIPDSLLRLPPDSLGVPKGLFQCHESCDWLQLDSASKIIWASGKESFGYNQVNDFKDYQCSLESGVLMITNNTRENSTIRVEIFDILGNRINQSVNATNASSVKMDINSLISINGVYVYRVYLNDIIYCTGKYIK